MTTDAIDPGFNVIGFNVEEYGHKELESTQEQAKIVPLDSARRKESEYSTLYTSQEKEKLYVEDYEVSKPDIELPEKSKSTKVSHIELVTKLMELSQRIVQDGEKTSMLKVEAVGKRLDNNKQVINEIVKDQHGLEEANDRWEWRKSVASNVLNVVSAAAGIGLLACGEPFSGTSLLVAGVGGLASSVMSFFGVKQEITQPIAVASAVVGAVGSIGGAVFNPTEIFNTFAQGAQFVSGLVSNVFSGYANYAQSEIQSSASEYDAKHTVKEKERRLLDEKLTGALTSHKSTVTPLSNILKGLAKAQKRMNTTLEGILRGQLA